MVPAGDLPAVTAATSTATAMITPDPPIIGNITKVLPPVLFDYKSYLNRI